MMQHANKDVAESLAGFEVPRLNPFTLSFQGKFSSLEAGFQRENFRNNSRRLRTLLGIAFLLYVALAFFDSTYGVVLQRKLQFIRFGVTTPGLLLLLAITFMPLYQRYSGVVSYFAMVFLSLTVALYEIAVRTAGDPTIFASILLLQMGLTLLLQPRFLWSLFTLLSMSAVFFAGDLIWNVYDPLVRMKEIMYLMIATGVASYASYRIEKTSRERYFYSCHYEEEQRLRMETEKLEMVRSMARTVAHEFNSPLSAIRGAYEYGIHNDLFKVDENRDHILLSIPKSVQRMEGLVQRLMSITQLREKKYVAGISMIDLSASSDSEYKTSELEKPLERL